MTDKDSIVETIIQSVIIEKYVESKIDKKVKEEIQNVLKNPDWKTKEELKDMIISLLSDREVKNKIKEIAESKH